MCYHVYSSKGNEKIFKGSDTMKEKIMNALNGANTTCKINDSQAMVYWNGFRFNKNTLEFLLKKANINYNVKRQTAENGHILTWYDCSGYEVVFVS